MQRTRIGGRLLIGIIMAVVALFGYFSKTQVNRVTGKKQQVSLTPEEEVAIGLQSAPQMAAEYGGLYRDEKVQFLAKKVGQSIVKILKPKILLTNLTFTFWPTLKPSTLLPFQLGRFLSPWVSAQTAQNRRPIGRESNHRD